MAAASWDATLKAELGVRTLPGEKGRPAKRLTRGDLEKKERRQKSRRWIAYDGLGALRRKIEARLERLECTNFNDPVQDGDGDADDEEDSDEFLDPGDDSSDEEDDDMDDMDEDDDEDGSGGDNLLDARDGGGDGSSSAGRKPRRSLGKSKAKVKAKSRTSRPAKAAGTKKSENSKTSKVLPLPASPAASAEEDLADAQDAKSTASGKTTSGREKRRRSTTAAAAAAPSGRQVKRLKRGTSESGAAAARGRKNKQSKTRLRIRRLAQVLLDENARKLADATCLDDLATPDYFAARAPKSRYPPRRFCVVTGLPAPYKDPESGLFFANAKALEQLKEQPPPWVRATANTPFHDALRIAAEERARLAKRFAQEQLKQSKQSSSPRAIDDSGTL